MKLQVSEKIGTVSKKPHIKKGYYPAKLLQVKDRKDKDGNWVESKFGRQIILLFQVLDPNSKQPIKDPEKKEEDLIMAQVLNSEYKQEDGSFRTAVTKNARITKVFEALGWKFDPTGLDTDNFIGKMVELNIDDYEAVNQDGNKYKASSIKDINKWEGEEPQPTSTPKPKEEVVQEKKIPEAKQKRIDEMKKLKEQGMLSEEGYKKAVEQIENE